MKAKEYRARWFWCGVFAHAAYYSLMQDFVGQKNYMKLVQERWISAWITVPLAIIALLVIFMVKKAEDNQFWRDK
jgi:hypothetical protein